VEDQKEAKVAVALFNVPIAGSRCQETKPKGPHVEYLSSSHS